MKFTRALAIALLGTGLALFASRTAAAQHETAADLLDGERAYRNTCANCHGPDGDVIAGIDLGRGRFRRPMTDDDLVRIIRTGIPNTPMPASQMTVEQAQKIVAYLRNRAAGARAGVTAGDPQRGKAAFERAGAAGAGGTAGTAGACTACHRVGAGGGRVGPDLTDVGLRRNATELERALLDPGADVAPPNRTYRVVLKDGTTVTGRLLGHDTFTVQLLDSKEQLRSFSKSELREMAFLPSPMPSYRGVLSPQEIADMVSYLSSLRGQ
jgi:putative heme-binding domain-containing protein